MDTLLKQFGINIDYYAALVAWSLLFTRTFTMLILVPFLGARGISGRIRLMVAIVLSVFAYVMMGEEIQTQLPEDKGVLIALYFKEIFIGIAIGVTTIMTFYAIQAAGSIVDNQRGSANAQIFSPQLGQVSIFGLLQFWFGLALFLSMMGHIPFLKAFFEGFQTVPVFRLPNIEPGLSPFLKLMIRMSADVLILGVQLAAPVLIAIFLTDLVLGIANKMAPQIPVFELGFLMKGYVGVVMVYVSIAVLAAQMDVFFDTMNTNVLKVIYYFR